MSLARNIVIAAALLLFSSPGHAQGQGPSFSCSNVDRTSEIAICESRRLSRMDRRVDRLYRESREAASRRSDRLVLRRSQASWLQERNACGSSRRCLQQKYRARIDELEREIANATRNDGGASYADNGGEGPSFNCRNVSSRTARAICRSTRLSRQDREMADLYVGIRGEVSGWRARRKLIRGQRNWLAKRNRCDGDRRCIRDAYRTRIADLSDVKRGLVPSYQRASNWRASCRNPAHRSLSAICRSEDLWSGFLNVLGAHNDQIRTRRNVRNRRRLVEDRRDWILALKECRGGERCLQRKMKQRFSAINDPGYLRPRRADYQREELWGTTCDRPSHVGIRTICGSDRLWKQYSDLSRLHNRTVRARQRARARERIRADRQEWLASLRECRRDERCLRRNLDRRTSLVGDPGYFVERRKSYQRADLWKSTCRRPDHVGMKTICGSERLWEDYREVTRTYRAVHKSANRQRKRRRLERDRREWIASLRSCRTDRQCLRRELRREARALGSRGDVGTGYFGRSAGACTVGTGLEQAICRSPRLHKLTKETSELYNAGRATMGRRGRRIFQQEQGAWVRGNLTCGSDVRCLIKRFRDRNYRLVDEAFLDRYRRLR